MLKKKNRFLQQIVKLRYGEAFAKENTKDRSQVMEEIIGMKWWIGGSFLFNIFYKRQFYRIQVLIQS